MSVISFVSVSRVVQPHHFCPTVISFNLLSALQRDSTDGMAVSQNQVGHHSCRVVSNHCHLQEESGLVDAAGDEAPNAKSEREDVRSPSAKVAVRVSFQVR